LGRSTGLQCRQLRRTPGHLTKASMQDSLLFLRVQAGVEASLSIRLSC
jgi:hypothetical protein